MKRFARVMAVGVLVAGLLGVFGAGSASAGSGEVGYTVGFETPLGGIECDLFSVELASGGLTRVNDPVEQVVECADGLTFAPDGTLYAYAGLFPIGAPTSQLITIDPTTGVSTEIGPLPPVILGNGGMTFDGAGNLWLYGTPTPGVDPDCPVVGAGACLWQVDPTDASTTFVGSTTERQVFGLAATCSEVLAITTPIPGGIGSGTEVARVDTATAALDLVVEADDVVLPEGLDFDFAGGLWALGAAPNGGIGTPMEVSNIDLTTGASTSSQLTLEGNPFIGFLFGLAISPISCPVPTPEPIVIEPLFTG